MSGKKRFRVCASVLALCVASAGMVQAAELNVVASFSIIEDLAKNVGGDRVTITTLVGPDSDAHVYEPKPADAVAMGKADVVLVNGLGFEGFLERLAKTGATKATIVEVSKGITPLKAEAEEEGHDHGHHDDHAHEKKAGDKHDHDHDKHAHDDKHSDHKGHDHAHGEFDPHAWQSIHNAEIYVNNIKDAFCAADAKGCDTYTANAKAYSAKLEALEAEVKAEIASIPEEKRVIITSHDAFGYFGQSYGLKLLAPEGVSTESEASAADVAKLIDQIKHDKASAIFVENISNDRLVQQIATETGVKVGGELYSDALSGPQGPASTYIDMFRYNVKTIKDAVLAK